MIIITQPAAVIGMFENSATLELAAVLGVKIVYCGKNVPAGKWKSCQWRNKKIYLLGLSDVRCVDPPWFDHMHKYTHARCARVHVRGVRVREGVRARECARVPHTPHATRRMPRATRAHATCTHVPHATFHMPQAHAAFHMPMPFLTPMPMRMHKQMLLSLAPAGCDCPMWLCS